MSSSQAGGRVLVTGGTGFIGTTLAQELADHAEEWVVLDNLHPQVHPGSEPPADLPGSVDLRVGDEPREPRRGRRRPAPRHGRAPRRRDRHRAVAVGEHPARHGQRRRHHAASRQPDPRGSGPRPLRAEQLARGLRRGHVAQPDGTTFQPGLRTHAMLEAGTWDHGDDGAAHVPNSVAGTHPNPVNVYGATKLAQEQILAACTGSHDTGLSVLRLKNVYGPRQSLSNPYTGIVSLFSRLAWEGQPIPLYEDGEITRDFVYVDDVVGALVAGIAESPADCMRTVDLGSGVRTTIGDLAREVARHHSAPGSHVTGQYRGIDVRHASCAVGDTVRRLDLEPRVSLGDGVARLQEWITGELGS